MSDSESSGGEQEESDEEAPIPPSPEPEKARIDSVSEDETVSTPQTEISDTRGKKKKLVDKTFMDEDGFLVTKKEWEYVDASGDEAEDKAKQSPKKVQEQPKKAEPSPVKK